MRFYGREEELRMLRGQTQLAIKHRDGAHGRGDGASPRRENVADRGGLRSCEYAGRNGRRSPLRRLFRLAGCHAKEALLSFHPTEAGFLAEGHMVTRSELQRKSPVYTKILHLLAAGTTKRKALFNHLGDFRRTLR